MIITLEPQAPQPGAGPKSSSLGTSSLPKGSERVLSTSGSCRYTEESQGSQRPLCPWLSVVPGWKMGISWVGGECWKGALVSPAGEGPCQTQLAKDRSRAGEHLHQSLLYLKDPQATERGEGRAREEEVTELCDQDWPCGTCGTGAQRLWIRSTAVSGGMGWQDGGEVSADTGIYLSSFYPSQPFGPWGQTPDLLAAQTILSVLSLQ